MPKRGTAYRVVVAGEAFAAVRQGLGLDQFALAEEWGVGRSTIQRIERGGASVADRDALLGLCYRRDKVDVFRANVGDPGQEALAL